MIDLRDRLNLDDSGTIDVTGKLRNWFKGGRSGLLPAGKYLTHDPIILDGQRLVGESADYDGLSGTTILCAGWGAKLGKFAGLENLNLVRVGGMGDIGAQLTIDSQDSNCSHLINVRISGFDVGFNNLGGDGSYIQGGALYDNRINGRTNTNEFLQVIRTPSSGALECGWEVTTLGGGLSLLNVTTTNNPCHVRLSTGARLYAQQCWFEGDADGEVAAIDGFSNGASNARAVLMACHRMAGSSIPFAKMAQGFLQFIACNGEAELDFEVDAGCQVLGQGEQGMKNGLAYTAAGYSP